MTTRLLRRAATQTKPKGAGMALSMDEQRILDEMERKLADEYPSLASELANFSVSRLRTCLCAVRARLGAVCSPVLAPCGRLRAKWSGMPKKRMQIIKIVAAVSALLIVLLVVVVVLFKMGPPYQASHLHSRQNPSPTSTQDTTGLPKG